MTGSQLKDLLLGVAAILGPLLAYLAATRAARVSAETLRETSALAAAAKQAETKQRVDDSTGAHVLEAWKVTLEEVKAERAELALERVTSKNDREEAKREREAAEHARRQAKLDNELAAAAVARNGECQEQLDAMHAELSAQSARMKVLEEEHAPCAPRIVALEASYAELLRASEVRNVTIAELRKEIATARLLLGLPEIPA